MKKFLQNIALSSSLLAFLACVYVTHALPSVFTVSKQRPYINWNDLKKMAAKGTHPPFTAFPATPEHCNDCVCGVGRKFRIVGGNASAIHDYPWMVGILKDNQFHCGGSLISRNYVLTAAHCIIGNDLTSFELRMGDRDIKKTGRHVFRRGIESWDIHEDFDPYKLDNDIAVIRMDAPVDFDGIVRPACLPQNSAIDYTGSMATAIGWGRTKEGAGVSKILRHVSVPVLSEEECDDSGYPKSRITDNMFCAGFLEGLKDACSGDSGGPLVVRSPTDNLEIIGITSFGRGCARPRYPGIYTKLTNYLGWLREHMEDDCVCPPPHRY